MDITNIQHTSLTSQSQAYLEESWFWTPSIPWSADIRYKQSSSAWIYWYSVLLLQSLNRYLWLWCNNLRSVLVTRATKWKYWSFVTLLSCYYFTYFASTVWLLSTRTLVGFWRAIIPSFCIVAAMSRGVIPEERTTHQVIFLMRLLW